MNNSKNVQVAYMYEVIELLKQLGIETVVKVEGDVHFFDIEGNEKMEFCEWDRYGYFQVRKEPITLNQIAASKSLMLRSLDNSILISMRHPIKDKMEDKSSLIINKITYNALDEDYIIELESLRTEKLNIYYFQNGSRENIPKTEITINGKDNTVDILETGKDYYRAGFMDDYRADFEDDGEDLSASEMMSIINNNKTIQAVVNYYSNHFANIASTIESLKEKANEPSK